MYRYKHPFFYTKNKSLLRMICPKWQDICEWCIELGVHSHLSQIWTKYNKILSGESVLTLGLLHCVSITNKKQRLHFRNVIYCCSNSQLYLKIILFSRYDAHLCRCFGIENTKELFSLITILTWSCNVLEMIKYWHWETVDRLKKVQARICTPICR